MTIYTVCLCLCVIIVLQAVLHTIERRDLYNRLMSRNLFEYKDKGKDNVGVVSAWKRNYDAWHGKGGNE